MKCHVFYVAGSVEERILAFRHQEERADTDALNVLASENVNMLGLSRRKIAFVLGLCEDAGEPRGTDQHS